LISVIIPLGLEEDAWRNLLKDLSALDANCEVIMVGPELPKQSEVTALLSGPTLELVDSPLGRAKQMNCAVNESNGEYLWFIHADSRLSKSAIDRALDLVNPQAKPQNLNPLYYFDLRFQNDGPFLTILNTVGVYIRCHILGIPFGDQGFLLSKETFFKLGGFPENSSYGEDHLLIWKAKHLGIKIISTGNAIYTSARKYRTQGWAQTTFTHLRLFIKQAWPEARSLLKERFVK